MSNVKPFGQILLEGEVDLRRDQVVLPMGDLQYLELRFTKAHHSLPPLRGHLGTFDAARKAAESSDRKRLERARKARAARARHDALQDVAGLSVTICLLFILAFVVGAL